jgi:hypothetical protein
MSIYRNTRPLDVSYLVVGLVFLGVAGSWALRELGLIDLAEVRWLLPAVLVAAGLTGVVAMTAKGLDRRRESGPEGDFGTDDHEGEAR